VLNWKHEVAHQIGVRQTTIGRRVPAPEVITSDAELRYEVRTSGRSTVIHRWLLEYDRSTRALWEVRRKIERYHEWWRHRGGVDPVERWAGACPPVLWVVEPRKTHPNPERRLRSIVEACHGESAYLAALFAAEGVNTLPAMYLTTKPEIVEHGPFGARWRLLGDPRGTRSIL
jgi:hypothetical protein